MRKTTFLRLLSGVLFIGGFALLILVGKHVFAAPNATGGAEKQTEDWLIEPAVSFGNSAVLVREGAPEDAVHWDPVEPGAKIAAGANANAVLSLDWIADGGAGNKRDDGVTTGTVSGQGTTIAIEVFATGVRTSLRGMIIKFEFDASFLAFVKAENSAFPLAIPDASVGTNLAATTPATLAASGFLARAEFETVADVSSREFSIGIESVTLAESSASIDEITTSRTITFNTVPSPDFDGDGTVGFSDFVALASVFGSQQGDANFDARFDLNGDGSIGFSDFVAFAADFGKAVEPAPPPGGGTGGGGGSGNTYGVGESLPNFPSGFFVPRLIRNASLTVSGGRAVLSFQSGGHVELQDGTAYTCIAAQGCSVEGGRVTSGTISVTGSGGGGGNGAVPDLVVESPSVTDNTLTTGQSFNLEATVRNRGYRFFFSDDLALLQFDQPDYHR